MWEKQHRQITQQALSKNLTVHGRKYILHGNDDSDKGTGAHYHIQHFHYSSTDKVCNSMQVVNECADFIHKCLSFAALCFLGGGKDLNHFPIGFYFLGRALHCGQDYYAHSNGVSIKHVNPEAIFAAQQHPQLKFCTPTTGSSGPLPLDKLLKNYYGSAFCNTSGYKKSVNNLEEACETFGLDYNKYSSKYRHPKDRKKLSLVLMIQSKKPMVHQHMHLDFEDSLADKAMKKIQGFGYRRAASHASDMTQLLFEIFEGFIETGDVGTVTHEVKQMNQALRVHQIPGFDVSNAISDYSQRKRLLKEMREYKPWHGIQPKLNKDMRRQIFDSCLNIGQDRGESGLDRGPEVH